MNLLGPAVTLYLRRIDRWLHRAAADPAAAQQRVLRDLLDRAKDTWFGRKHSFASIADAAEFAGAVPIVDYVDRLDQIERMLAGEADVCWPGVVRHFAQTSGTTAGDKRIPVTGDMQRSNARAALALFTYYGRRGKGLVSSVMAGQLLFLGGSTTLTPTPAGGWVGDLSGIASRSIRWPLSRHYEPGPELAVLDDWEEKIERVAQRVIDRDVRMITGMPSWMKILFDRLCAMRGIDTEGGMSRLWPNLSLLIHGGVNFAPYRSTFERYFREDHGLHFLEVYPASEGFIAIQPEAGDPGMEMLVDNGIFYEFVPLDQWGREDAPRLTIDQVQRDVPYCVILSTNAGLWAYEIGDVVRFVSLRPPRIVFAGRNKHFINAFGENIIGENVSEAVAVAATATGAEVAEFTASPRYADATHAVGAHQYVVEFEREPANLGAFAAEIDRTLQQVNNDYSVKRKGDLGMTTVEVSAVPSGTFYAWMKSRDKLGGQNKVPLCANDRRYVDELIATAAQSLSK